MLVLICFGTAMEKQSSFLFFCVSCLFKVTMLETTTSETQHKTSVLFWLPIEMLVQLLQAAPCCLETKRKEKIISRPSELLCRVDIRSWEHLDSPAHPEI